MKYYKLFVFVLLNAALLSHSSLSSAENKSYNDCNVNERLSFKDKKGCLENIKFLGKEFISTFGKRNPRAAVTKDPQQCPYAYGTSWGTNSQYVSNCERRLLSQGASDENCGCEDIESIAKRLTEKEFILFDSQLEERKRIGWKRQGKVIALSTGVQPKDAEPKVIVKNLSNEKDREDENNASVKSPENLATKNEINDKKLLSEAQEIVAKEKERVKERQRLAEVSRAREAELLAKQAAERERIASLERELSRTRQELQEKNTALVQKAPSAVKNMEAHKNKKAFLIGNNNYSNVPKLNNAVEDAESMANALQNMGYQVSQHANLKERDFKRQLRNFVSTLVGGDEVVFFYAGHGVQLSNTNFLLPTDITADNPAAVRDEAINLSRILDDFSEAKVRVTVAIIDACRDDPFKGKSSRSLGTRGLAPTSVASGQLIVYSAGAGQQALDKLGPNDASQNGLFTRVFLKQIQKSNDLTVDRIVKNVRQEVVSLAKSVGHEQVPAIYDQLVGDFYFAK
jgi:hypothetical protein